VAEQQSASAEALCDLERYLATAQEKHLGLPEVEAESVARGREVVRVALQGHIDARGNGDVGAAIDLDGPGGPIRLGYKRLHTRRIVSLVGSCASPGWDMPPQGMPASILSTPSFAYRAVRSATTTSGT
jgi:hypothetical protein